jgi:hypothetical protein
MITNDSMQVKVYWFFCVFGMEVYDMTMMYNYGRIIDRCETTVRLSRTK